MRNCDSYNSCKVQEKENMRYPNDQRSLYVNRIVDNQTANRRCYERNPINIVEGFGNFDTDNLMQMLQWVVFIILIIVALNYFMQYIRKEQISFGFSGGGVDSIEFTEDIKFIKNLFN